MYVTVETVPPRQAEKGSMLIIMAILVLIGGLALAGTVSLLRPVDREAQEAITHQKMDQIMTALSVYAKRNGRLPCPAEPDQGVSAQPFGAERGSGPNGEAPEGSCSGTTEFGIVPFRTLGLSEDVARDGWKNFMSYYAPDSGLFLPSGPAVVLVSHGRNGHGVYLDDGTRAKMGIISALESENANDDATFVSRLRNDADSDEYFDDMIAMRTGAELLDCFPDETSPGGCEPYIERTRCAAPPTTGQCSLHSDGECEGQNGGICLSAGEPVPDDYRRCACGSAAGECELASSGGKINVQGSCFSY